jgi:hypothetical protein
VDVPYKRPWIGLAALIIVSFAILGYHGGEIYRLAPPLPERVITPEGELIWHGRDIKDGQNAWQSIGGQQLGSIWDMGPMWRPTGRPTGSIARVSGSWTIEPGNKLISRLTPWTRAHRLNS